MERREAAASAARLIERHGPQTPARAEPMATVAGIPAACTLWRLMVALAAELLRGSAGDAAQSHRKAACERRHRRG